MLCHRVIPLVLLDGYSVLKTINFDVRRNLGNPITVAKVYNNRNVDELILLDIDASKEERGIDLNTVTEVAKQCFMPLTVGGGIRNCEDISNLLMAGADKVAINSSFLRNGNFIKQAVDTFGSQCIVISLDIMKNTNNDFKIFSHSGIKYSKNLNECLMSISEYNVGELLLNNVDRDGKMRGYDLEIIKMVTSSLDIPIIVAGGAGEPMHLANAIKAGASAVSAASIFHFTSFTPNDCKKTMSESGITVRTV